MVTISYETLSKYVLQILDDKNARCYEKIGIGFICLRDEDGTIISIDNDTYGLLKRVEDKYVLYTSFNSEVFHYFYDQHLGFNKNGDPIYEVIKTRISFMGKIRKNMSIKANTCEGDICYEVKNPQPVKPYKWNPPEYKDIHECYTDTRKYFCINDLMKYGIEGVNLELSMLMGCDLWFESKDKTEFLLNEALAEKDVEKHFCNLLRMVSNLKDEVAVPDYILNGSIEQQIVDFFTLQPASKTSDVTAVDANGLKIVNRMTIFTQLFYLLKRYLNTNDWIKVKGNKYENKKYNITIDKRGSEFGFRVKNIYCAYPGDSDWIMCLKL